jgi:hypothetical protein
MYVLSGLCGCGGGMVVEEGMWKRKHIKEVYIKSIEE